MTTAVDHLASALAQSDASARLHAALTAGTYPRDEYLEPLVAQCAAEPDFSVREMLTWALTRLSHEVVLRRVTDELASPLAQARSQALHTLSKLGDPRAWSAITAEHLHDQDDEVARAAWRAAAGLAPEVARDALARELTKELGRGDREIQRSLARAFAALGDAGVRAATASLMAGDGAARIHAAATLRLIHDPESTFHLDPEDG